MAGCFQSPTHRKQLEYADRFQDENMEDRSRSTLLSLSALCRFFLQSQIHRVFNHLIEGVQLFVFFDIFTRLKIYSQDSLALERARRNQDKEAS
jgi:hypothetical protein